MPSLQMIKDGIMIMSRFGLRHALSRYKDFKLMKQEDERKNKVYKKLKPSGEVTKNILGNRMKLDMNDYGIHRDLFLDGIKEPMATNHLMKSLSKNDVVLDIGANIGYYVLIESMLCRRVYAVEPYFKNINYLKTNLELNRRQNVETFEMAMGDIEGHQAMNISERSNWHSFYPIKDVSGKINVKMGTVDNFLKEKEIPSFVRMDVEGYELCILKGMKKSLHKIARLFIEIHASMMTLKETRDLIDILREREFQPELIIKYDKPGFSRILPNDYLKRIYRGDKGIYEVFFKR